MLSPRRPVARVRVRNLAWLPAPELGEPAALTPACAPVPVPVAQPLGRALLLRGGAEPAPRSRRLPARARDLTRGAYRHPCACAPYAVARVSGEGAPLPYRSDGVLPSARNGFLPAPGLHWCQVAGPLGRLFQESEVRHVAFPHQASVASGRCEARPQHPRGPQARARRVSDAEIVVMWAAYVFTIVGNAVIEAGQVGGVTSGDRRLRRVHLVHAGGLRVLHLDAHLRCPGGVAGRLHARRPDPLGTLGAHGRSVRGQQRLQRAVACFVALPDGGGVFRRHCGGVVRACCAVPCACASRRAACGGGRPSPSTPPG